VSNNGGEVHERTVSLAEIAHNFAKIEEHLFHAPALKWAKSSLDLRLVVKNGIQQ
jgi:hypothetical protein